MIRGSDSLWLVSKTDANRNPKNKKDPHIIVQIALMGKDLEKLQRLKLPFLLELPS